jgi:hypothetical protein
MRMMRMHYPSPQWLAKLMDYILAQQMADARELPKQVMVFHPRGGESRMPPAGRTWTPGGIAIDQVSKYTYQA